jgi:uncharacterized membrane protein
MILLILGLVAWFVLHLFPIFAVQKRAALKESLGGAYMGGYALATVGAVALMTIGYQQAPFVEIWSPPAFLTHLNNLLMVLAIFVFIAGRLPSVVRNKIRHPQLTAVKIWALAHLLVNGDLASIILFGGMLAWAVVALIGTNKRDGKPPLAYEATAQGLAAHIAIAIIVSTVVIWLHDLAGIWPLPG